MINNDKPNPIDALNYRYAGFWRRLCAEIIDALVVAIAVFIIIFFYSILKELLRNSSPGSLQANSDTDLCNNLLYLLFFGIGVYIMISYSAHMISSKLQATIGKIALGIIVVDTYYQKLSFGRSLGRGLCKQLSIRIFGIGGLFILCNKKKRALHDMLVGTLVIHKP